MGGRRGTSDTHAMSVPAEVLGFALPRKHPGGRPPLENVHRPEACPANHAGRIRLEGRYATKHPHFERVRWRCVPADPVISQHRFTAVLPARHPRASHPHSGEACPTCEHVYDPHEGPKTGRGRHYAIAEATAALIGVGQGMSLRDCSARLRVTGLKRWATWVPPQRPKARGTHGPRVTRQGAEETNPPDEAAVATAPAPPPGIEWEPNYDTFEPEPWTVPLPEPPDPDAPSPTLREIIGDDPDEIERWKKLREFATEYPHAVRVPELDERIEPMQLDLPEIDRFGFGVQSDFLAELGLEGEPEPLDYRPEEVPERRDLATRPWARVLGLASDAPSTTEREGAAPLRTGGVSRQPAIVCDYLDLFAPAVLAPLQPTRWPDVAVIDSLPIRRGKWIAGRRIARGQKTGEIVAVMDATNPFRQVPVYLCVLGGKDRSSWAELFRRFEGAPRWLVTDRDAGLSAAVAREWPDTTHYLCEGHLLRNMRERAIADSVLEGSLATRNPVWEAMDRAQRRPERWDEFKAAVEREVPLGRDGLRSWIRENEDLVLAQMTLRSRVPGNVRGTGAAEAVLVEVRRLLGKRAGQFRNRKRLDLVLGLVCAQMAHHADPIAYAGAIRSFLEAGGGATGMGRTTWARMRDRWVGTCSIDRMLREADLRAAYEADEEERERLRQKRVGDRDERLAERVAEGLPHLDGISRRADAGRRARRAEPMREWLRDYPELLAQWHPTRNSGVDPLAVRAKSNEKRWWLCREHAAASELYPGHLHEWEARVSNRTRDGMRCGYCSRRRVCPGNCVRATHPAVAAAWHPWLNEDRRPDDYTSGSQVEAWFVCEKHGDYRKLIRDACRYGCPECGIERGRAKHQAAKQAKRKERRALAKEARELRAMAAGTDRDNAPETSAQPRREPARDDTETARDRSSST